MTGGRRTQVVVVGGGPAGTAAALVLARRGAEVLLLDRARFPRPKPCGQYVGPDGARLLGVLGLWEAVQGAGARPLTGMRIEAPDGSVLLGRFPGGPAAGPDGPVAFALSREALDAALKRVPGVPNFTSTWASPRPVVLLMPGNGLLRQASSRMMRVLLGTEVSVLRMSLSRTACSGMSVSRFGSMSTGTRKFSPSICRPCPA